jgi:hypothetical protein
VHGLTRNELVVPIGLKAIVALFYWRFCHGARARAYPMSEFRNGEFGFAFGMYYIGIQDCTIFFFLQSPLYLPSNYQKVAGIGMILVGDALSEA